METEQFDLVVIGGGPSGYAGAMRAIDFGKRVLLIEKKRIGGAGVYNGVLTSKTLWEQALKVASIREMMPNYEPKFEQFSKIVDATSRFMSLSSTTRMVMYFKKSLVIFSVTIAGKFA